MKAFKEPINYEGLEEELHEALKADELYSLQNDAKFRAIEQSVPTYEDFRQMVNAAHLKPLDRKDMTPKVGVKWNAIANDNESLQSIKGRSKSNFDQQSDKQFFPQSIPKNRHEFLKVWKLLNYQNKFRLLQETRLVLTNEIFRSEIPPDILIDCIVTCLQNLETPNNEKFVIEILSTLSECNRFKLAIEFMSSQDKSICHELFEILHRTKKEEDQTIVNNLEKMYLLKK